MQARPTTATAGHACSRWGATGRTREQHPALAQQWSLSPLCKNALSARNGGLKLLLKTTAVLRMSKSKKKQTVQPAVAAAPSPSQLSPSREESEAPLQLSTLSFKRTRSSQVRSLPVQNHLLPFSSCPHSSAVLFCSIFAVFYLL